MDYIYTLKYGSYDHPGGFNDVCVDEKSIVAFLTAECLAIHLLRLDIYKEQATLDNNPEKYTKDELVNTIRNLDAYKPFIVYFNNNFEDGNNFGVIECIPLVMIGDWKKLDIDTLWDIERK